jgi:hypothetical protein
MCKLLVYFCTCLCVTVGYVKSLRASNGPHFTTSMGSAYIKCSMVAYITEIKHTLMYASRFCLLVRFLFALGTYLSSLLL